MEGEVDLKSSVLAFLIEFIRQVAEHKCRDDRESISHIRPLRALKRIPLIKETNWENIKFVFGSSPARIGTSLRPTGQFFRFPNNTKSDPNDQNC